MLSRRIVIDTVRRLWTVYAMLSGGILGLSWIGARAFANGADLGAMGDVRALSMASAWFLALTPAIVLEQREIARLPVSRREMWIARWWLSTIVPAVLIAAALLLAAQVSGPQWPSGNAVVFPALYALLYGGCFMAVTALLPFRQAADSTGGTVVRSLFLIFVVMLGGAGWPFWFARYLPHTLAELGGPALGSIIAAAGVTVASYFNHPPVTARPSRPTFKRKAPVWPAAGKETSRLSGLPFLYWKEARKALLLNGSLISVAILYWWLFESGPRAVGEVIRFTSLADFLNAGSALMFADVSIRSTRVHFPAVAMMLLASTSDVGLMGEMRRFRTLPVSVTRLAGISSSLSVLTTSVFWIALLLLHVISLGTAPDSLRPDLFLVISGSIAVCLAIRLALPVHPFLKVVGTGLLIAPAFIVFPLETSHTDAGISAAMMAGGAAALVLSVLFNRWALRRGSRIYKPQSLLTIPGGLGPPAS